MSASLQPLTSKSRRFITWTEFGSLCEKLYEDIALLHLDGIVGIGRGGVMIGAYLAHKMGLPLYPVFVRHVGGGEDMKVVADDLGHIEKFVRGSILLVDDWLITGKAMSFVKSYISDRVYVRTAAMVCNPDSEVKPDYVGLYSRDEIFYVYD
jgi:hypoxanthine phosphoribosyltransferase